MTCPAEAAAALIECFKHSIRSVGTFGFCHGPSDAQLCSNMQLVDFMKVHCPISLMLMSK